MAMFWYPEVPVPIILGAPRYYAPNIIHNVYVALLLNAAYVLSMIIARKTVSELRQRSAQTSAKTKQLQAQLERYFRVSLHVYRFT